LRTPGTNDAAIAVATEDTADDIDIARSKMTLSQEIIRGPNYIRSDVSICLNVDKPQAGLSEACANRTIRHQIVRKGDVQLTSCENP
jgi:hypothetical protein